MTNLRRMRKVLDQIPYARHLMYGVVTGLVIAVVAFIAFGIMDVQCHKDPNGAYWNARAQSCQMSEVM